nr:MAG TPA: hypothetical protein [Caudoviricetes sp.]
MVNAEARFDAVRLARYDSVGRGSRLTLRPHNGEGK